MYSRCVAVSVKSRNKESAAGRGQPKISPTCDDKYKDLRPVEVCTRTNDCRTGWNRARSSLLKSLKFVWGREYICECSPTRSSTSDLVSSSNAL